MATSAPVEQMVTTPTRVPAALSSSETPSPTETATPSPVPAGLIRVDTLEQEVYPFIENGKCSLAEAILAANSGEPKDTCAAGAPDQSVIELMPGEYHFTQSDHTPPQVEWAISTSTGGNALPAVIRALTIHGDGAELIRDEGSERFRFFEVMFGRLALDNMTLQGGDVGEADWGGAIYAANVSVTLDGVRIVNNYAENGGGLYLSLGALTVSNSEFIENRGGFAGGGIYLDSAKANIRTSKFVGNQAGGQGGGLRAETVPCQWRTASFCRISLTVRGEAGSIFIMSMC